MGGQITASSANTSGAISDITGVNVANTADVGGLTSSASNTASADQLTAPVSKIPSIESPVGTTTTSQISRSTYSPSIIPTSSSFGGAIKNPLNFSTLTGNALRGTSLGMAPLSAIRSFGGAIKNPLNFSTLTGNVLRGTSLGINPLTSVGTNLSSLMSTGMPISPTLETASFNDKMNEIKAIGTAAGNIQMPIINQQSRGSEGARGLSTGSGIGIEIRNPESSLRKLTDSVIATTFG